MYDINKNISEDEKRVRESKLPIDVLVTLGDSLHDCTASFVLSLKPTPDEDLDNEVTFATHGSKKQVISMFTEMFKENNEFIEIIMEAVVRCKLDNLVKKDATDF